MCNLVRLGGFTIDDVPCAEHTANYRAQLRCAAVILCSKHTAVWFDRSQTPVASWVDNEYIAKSNCVCLITVSVVLTLLHLATHTQTQTSNIKHQNRPTRQRFCDNNDNCYGQCRNHLRLHALTAVVWRWIFRSRIVRHARGQYAAADANANWIVLINLENDNNDDAGNGTANTVNTCIHKYAHNVARSTGQH